MRTLFCDTETTGLPDWHAPSDGPQQPHIVQLAALVMDDQRRTVSALDLVISPDGWEIPDDVAKIHGITTEKARELGINEVDAVDLLIQLWRKCENRVAYSEPFDARIIRIALKRYFNEMLAEEWSNGARECAMRMAKPVCRVMKLGTGAIKQPTLREAVFVLFGEDLDGAHTAMADTAACARVYWHLKDGLGVSALADQPDGTDVLIDPWGNS